VQDRPQQGEVDERPSIDAAILAELERMGVDVVEPEPAAPSWQRCLVPPELGPAS
jgi:hypothetical protein